MPRSGAEARGRLETAAFDLFLERGFDAVTTAEIAERAGVTERTYFRHFADKREVLFDGERRLVGWVETAMARVPAGLGAFAAMRHVVGEIVPELEANGVESGRLGRIVAATPALAERAAAKEAHLIEVLTALLVDRGASGIEAALAARVAWAALTHAMGEWRAEPAEGLAAHVDRAFGALRDVVAS